MLKVFLTVDMSGVGTKKMTIMDFDAILTRLSDRRQTRLLERETAVAVLFNCVDICLYRFGFWKTDKILKIDYLKSC